MVTPIEMVSALTTLSVMVGALGTFGSVPVMLAGVILEKHRLIDAGGVAGLCGCVAYSVAVGGTSILT